MIRPIHTFIHYQNHVTGHDAMPVCMYLCTFVQLSSCRYVWKHQPNMVIFAKDDWRGFSTWLAMFEQKLDHPQLINLFYLGIFHKRTEASTKDLEKMLLAFLKVHRDVVLSCERMTLLPTFYFFISL